MGMTDVGGVPAVMTSHSGDGLFGGSGFVAGLVLAALFRDRGFGFGGGGAGAGVGAAIAATDTSEIIGAINSSQNSINANVQANAIAAAQGIGAIQQQICAEGRASDANLFNQTTALMNTINCGNKELNNTVVAGFAGVQSALCQLSHQTALGFKDVQLQASQDTCKIIGVTHAEGEATRALITQNVINEKNLQIDILSEQAREAKFLHEIEKLKIVINNINQNGTGNTINPPPATAPAGLAVK